MSRHDLTVLGGVSRLPVAVPQQSVNNDAINALIAVTLANAAKPEGKVEHHYLSKSSGILGSLVMLSGFLSISLLIYSAVSGQSASETVSKIEVAASEKIETVSDMEMPDFAAPIGAYFKKASKSKDTALDASGSVLKVGDKVVSIGGFLTVKDIDATGETVVVTLSKDYPEDKRPRVLFGQEQINKHKILKSKSVYVK